MNNHSMARTLRLVIACLLLVAVQTSLAAKDKKKGKETKKVEEPVEVKPVWPSPLDPGRVDQVFRELPFGQGREGFAVALQQRFEEQLRPILRATQSATERDSLKAKMEKSLEAVADSFTPFDGRRSGYTVSVVAQEFQQNAGESVMKYSYGENTAYFFFSQDSLFKLFICAGDQEDFASLLVNLATIYGDPGEIVHADEEKTIPVVATWKDSTFQLQAARPEGIFVCSRLVWTYLPALPAIEKRRQEATAQQQAPDDADAILQRLREQTPEDDSDILDQIIKKKKQE